MEIDRPILFIEITDKSYNFVAGVFDEEHNLKIVEKIISYNEGFDKNKLVDIESASKIIKKSVTIIEKKLDHVFKDLTLIIDSFDYSCINITGFKKLNGSQVLKDNISYILNSLRLSVSDNEKNNTILHIFNSKYILDGTNIENLPIGLFGDFYSHELTFFLIKNNDLKNIQKIFNNNNISIKKIILKPFSEGTLITNQNNDIDTFFRIKINDDTSYINFFNKASFRYSEKFNFGTNIILKDIEKISKLNLEMIRKFLSNKFLNKENFDENEILEKHYFAAENFRKIRKKLIFDIAIARVHEIADIIFNKNINIRSLKENKIKIYLTIKDKEIRNNFKENFKNYFSQNDNYEVLFIDEFNIEESIINIANLSVYGWKKEAIPTIKVKNSLITRIFKYLFG